MALITLLSCGLLIGSPGYAVAASPVVPEHGFDEDTYYPLWSGDDDSGAPPEADTGSIATLASFTDIPFDAPPVAVEHWNEADHADFPVSGEHVAYHPSGTVLSDSRFIRDAAVSIFAVQPSTRVHRTPTETPLYVASTGTVLGTVDYRLQIPAADTHGSERVDWEVLTSEIASIQLLVDGQPVAAIAETHTPALQYTGLSGDIHTLTLTARIDTTLVKTETSRHETCTLTTTTPSEHTPTTNSTSPSRSPSTCRAVWERTTEQVVDSITVTDSIQVTPHAPQTSGSITTYPNGDLGLATDATTPWAAYTVPGGTLRGVWHFYSARDSDWDTLTVSGKQRTTSVPSPLIPLQVHAYPSRAAPTVAPSSAISLLDIAGAETAVPLLPEAIALDTPDESYLTSTHLVTRLSDPGSLSTITVHGLVRGVTTDVEFSELTAITLHPITLNVTVLDEIADEATLTIKLRDVDTGNPLDTSRRDGYLSVNGARLETDVSGTVTQRVPRSTAGYSARFVPGPWWQTDPSYAPASDIVASPAPPLHLLDALSRLGVYTGVFLVAAFLIDRATGWRIWPPWRGL